MKEPLLHHQVRKLVVAVEKLAERIVSMESTMRELSDDIAATYLAETRVVPIDRARQIRNALASPDVNQLTDKRPRAAKCTSGKTRPRR